MDFINNTRPSGWATHPKPNKIVVVSRPHIHSHHNHTSTLVHQWRRKGLRSTVATVVDPRCHRHSYPVVTHGPPPCWPSYMTHSQGVTWHASSSGRLWGYSLYQCTRCVTLRCDQRSLAVYGPTTMSSGHARCTLGLSSRRYGRSRPSWEAAPLDVSQRRVVYSVAAHGGTPRRSLDVLAPEALHRHVEHAERERHVYHLLHGTVDW